VALFFANTPASPKICGITTREDALVALAAGAGALGFNFYPPSPRAISCTADFGWIRELRASSPRSARVAVVVNPDAHLLQRLREADCFEAIQFHGDESPEFCAAEGARFPCWIKALRIRDAADLRLATYFKTPFFLLDAAVLGSYGGSGHQLDWGLAAQFVAEHPERRVILAGGLTSENVAQAVAQVHPHAVDVASGVEISPGVKDLKKVREFIAAASKQPGV
jgi:phosphoribosylanthranilate isomerase